MSKRYNFKLGVLFSLMAGCLTANAQTGASPGYWQQKVKYTMNIDVDAEANQFKGKQQLEYWNQSPDTLKRVYYHLYWNAFQPGSMMDERSIRQSTINKPGGGADWDNRVRDRISKLQPDEIGYQKINSLTLNGNPLSFKVMGTILQVDLTTPILPGARANFNMDFEAQVPVQIRRAGRNNAEGVRFSMSQWYPKICEYDKDGWHPNPYIAREFYGVWGDFDVTINIDSSFVIGATGYLQNPQQIGHGYQAAGAPFKRPAGKKLSWRFVAPMVHDFVWAADPEYIHIKKTVRDNTELHAFYKIDKDKLIAQYNALTARQKAVYNNNALAYVAQYRKDWENVLDFAEKALIYIDKTFGKYPYKQYSFIQGGDGGMEYPMATLVKSAGEELILHEWMHTWYQMILGTNESLYPWMDEGFTNYAESRILQHLYPDREDAGQGDNYRAYIALVKSGLEEPLTTHADHYNSNYAYSSASYTKGAVFIEQLGYIIGAAVRDSLLLKYFDYWKFKHPTPADFMRIAEKLSGMELDWYKEYWINTTKTIDYGFDSLWEEGGKTKIRIKRVQQMPMPIDLKITLKDGSSEVHYVPIDLMYGVKPAEDNSPRIVYDPWPWTREKFVITTDKRIADFVSVEIDPSQRLADIDRRNNKLVLR